MSATTLLTCDGCGAERRDPTAARWAVKLSAATEAGWDTSEHGDFCRSCAAAEDADTCPADVPHVSTPRTSITWKPCGKEPAEGSMFCTLHAYLDDRTEVTV